MINQIVFVSIAYLIGSLSFGIIVSKFLGSVDPRTIGSKNPGATNVMRGGNKVAAILTLSGDLLKATLIIVLAKSMTLNDITISFIALAVLLGHIFPIYYRFNGGKGVATAFGIFLGLDLFFAAIILCVWIITFLIWRYSSLAAIIASISAPVVAWLLSLSQEFILLTLVIAVIVLCRHQSNINNLIHGNEKGFKK